MGNKITCGCGGQYKLYDKIIGMSFDGNGQSHAIVWICDNCHLQISAHKDNECQLPKTYQDYYTLVKVAVRDEL